MRELTAGLLLAFSPPTSQVAPQTSERAAAVLEPDEAPRVRLEDVRARFTFFDQHGRGYQSQAGPVAGPGSERLVVYQPAMSLRLRGKDERVAQTIALSFDVVTAASPDALDAMSAASRTNEAGTLELQTTIEPNRNSRIDVRYGAHIEEHWRTGFGGLGYAFAVLDQALWFSAATNFVGDSFDPVSHLGTSGPQEQRYAINQNVSVDAILSRTTTGSLSYGFTAQWGTLANTWNSVYVAPSTPCDQESECGTRVGEALPTRRLRHAIEGQLHQHVPKTLTTIVLGYRYYRDDFGLQAHTGSLVLYQYIVPRRLYLRAFYRAHWQSGVDFYTTGLSEDDLPASVRTADSDLGTFWAHHAGGKLALRLHSRNDPTAAHHVLSVDYSRYQRTTGLSMNVFGIGYAREF